MLIYIYELTSIKTIRIISKSNQNCVIWFTFILHIIS